LRTSRAVLARLLLALSAIAAPSPNAWAQGNPPSRGADDVTRARALDKEGAKAYADGRYNDAIRYYEEAHRLGGPPFELWNIAKCRLRMDQPAEAAEMLEKYLALPNLPADDRAEATRELEELRKRTSTLTVSSSPSGADVTLDGKLLDGSKTPMSITVPPGQHSVTVTWPNRATYTRQVEAKYGRAIIVDATPGESSAPPPPKPELPPKPEKPEKPPEPEGPEEPRPLQVRGSVGVVFPRYGDVGGDGNVGAFVSGTYRVFGEAPGISLGGLVFLTGDSWKNTVNAPTTGPGCAGSLRNPLEATALSLYALGTGGVDIVPKLRALGMLGAGIATYLVDDVGGDLFVPSCNTSPGVRPSFMAGAQIDWAVSGPFRLSAWPLLLQLQPAFDGTRSSPKDASGVWLRVMLALGVGMDF
jgi:hypothetical protein